MARMWQANGAGVLAAWLVLAAGSAAALAQQDAAEAGAGGAGGAGNGGGEAAEAAGEPRVNEDQAPSFQRPQVGFAESLTVTLEGSSRLAFRADVRDTDADVQVWHNRLGVNVTGKAAEKLLLTFGVGGEISSYDFGGDDDIFPGGAEPIDEIYGGNVLLGASYVLSDPWSVTVAGFGSFLGEEGADFGDSVVGGGFAGVGYSFSRDLRLTVGAGATTQLEDEAQFIPYISLYWRFAERFLLETRGPGLKLTAEINEQFEVALFGGFEGRQIRLSDDRATFRDGVVRDDRVPIGVELAWKPIPNLRVAVEGGAIVYQQYEFIDTDEKDRGDLDTDPAAFVGLNVEFRF